MNENMFSLSLFEKPSFVTPKDENPPQGRYVDSMLVKEKKPYKDCIED